MVMLINTLGSIEPPAHSMYILEHANYAITNGLDSVKSYFGLSFIHNLSVVSVLFPLITF